MAAWIDTDQVFAALKTGNLAPLTASGCRYCISNDGKSCVLIRRHHAWHIEGEGWHDSNAPPCGNQTGRDVLNFFTLSSDDIPGRWFKCFLPSNLAVTALRSDGLYYELQAPPSVYRASFERIPVLMWDLITGHAQPEDIASKFRAIWEDV